MLLRDREKMDHVKRSINVTLLQPDWAPVGLPSISKPQWFSDPNVKTFGERLETIKHALEVIPTPSHVLGRISPIFSPFFPVFCAFSPPRRDGSNEPQAGTQGQETVARAPKHRFAGLS